MRRIFDVAVGLSVVMSLGLAMSIGKGLGEFDFGPVANLLIVVGALAYAVGIAWAYTKRDAGGDDAL